MIGGGGNLADENKTKTSSIIMSGSPASEYLIGGETVKWQGKPAAIVILGRGLVLTFLSLSYLGAMLSYKPDDWVAIAIALFASFVMIVVERRVGLLAGLSGIAIAGAVALGWLSMEKYPWAAIIPLIFSLLALLFNMIYLGRVLFLVTDRRIITRYGLFSLRYADLGVDKVQNVTLIQPWYERILGYGDIYFATAGEKGGIDYQAPGIRLMTGGAVTWENVSKPFEVVKIASEVMHPGAMPVRIVGDYPSATPDAQQRLKELNDLKDKGLISDKEYEEKRKDILGKL
jgi:hypothetical protein